MRTPRINKAMLAGRLGQSPEVKELEDGRKLAIFSIATNEGWKDRKTGEWVDKTVWHNIRLWGKAAENAINAGLDKGDFIIIDGKIAVDTWEHDGQKRSKTFVEASVGSQLQILNQKSKEAGDVVSENAPEDDDLPF